MMMNHYIFKMSWYHMIPMEHVAPRLQAYMQFSHFPKVRKIKMHLVVALIFQAAKTQTQSKFWYHCCPFQKSIYTSLN